MPGTVLGNPCPSHASHPLSSLPLPPTKPNRNATPRLSAACCCACACVTLAAPRGGGLRSPASASAIGTAAAAPAAATRRGAWTSSTSPRSFFGARPAGRATRRWRLRRAPPAWLGYMRGACALHMRTCNGQQQHHGPSPRTCRTRAAAVQRAPRHVLHAAWPPVPAPVCCRAAVHR